MVVLAALLSACATLSPPRSELTERVGRSDLDVSALRVRVRDMARRFSGLLEAMADGLASHSDSPEVARAMLTFKANAVPAMQGALFQSDPVAALVDAWALLAQLQDVLPKRAELAPPELQAEARRSLGDMESQVEALWRELTGREDVSSARRLIHEWAAAHPLTGNLVARESTAPLLASVSEVSGGGLLKRAAGLLEGTRDIIRAGGPLCVQPPSSGPLAGGTPGRRCHERAHPPVRHGRAGAHGGHPRSRGRHGRERARAGGP